MPFNVWLFILRVIGTVAILYLLSRLMGKRQISQLGFFDYVAGISIGTIAATLAIDTTMNYVQGLIALVIWAIVPIALSFMALKNKKARDITEGRPSILIQNGKIIEKNLRQSRLNINDVLKECRQKNAFSLSDVEFAILETDGKVSVLLKSERQPLTPQDIHMPLQKRSMAVNLIIDGEILFKNLAGIQKDETWLKAEMEKQNYRSTEGVLLAYLDADGYLRIDPKSSDPEPLHFS